MRLPVSLVWVAVFHPPEGMEDWSYHRIEYAGHATECIVEGGIWLPPWADPEDIEEYLMRTQRREDCHKLSSSVDKCREVTPEVTPEVEEE